uniref:Ig-like domain-containing protein n=1 Tax=Leptobrachium leishanense TaxID=445787 RepID=A0A8C5LYY5_9ANUR
MGSTQLILALLMLAYGVQSTEDASLSKTRKIVCSFDKPFHLDHASAQNPETPKSALLFLRSWMGSDDEDGFDRESIRFFLKDSSLKLLQSLKADADKLACEIKLYFTDNIQVLWPGVHSNDQAMDSWFIATMKHTEGDYHLTIFLYQVPESPPQGMLSAESHNSQSVRTHHVSAAFAVRTRTPVIQSKLKQDVLLDCTFSIDHPADVMVTWTLNKKGREGINLLSYSGSTKQIQHYSKNVVIQEEELAKGNASILMRNVDIEKQGFYYCSVVVASLYWDQKIHLEIAESPIVEVNAKSLSLVEGEDQKLLCDASHYYPLDVSIEWLKEDRGQTFLPIKVQNIIFSSHKYNRDGTYSISSYFMYKARLQDNGVVFTCRVEHSSLALSIRRSVNIYVTGSSRWSFELWLLVSLILIFSAILVYTAKYFFRGRPYNQRPY